MNKDKIALIANINLSEAIENEVKNNLQQINGVTYEQISLLAPSALKEQLTTTDLLVLGRSNRYVFVDSTKVKNFMEKLGWILSEIRSPKSKKYPDTGQHTMHFRNSIWDISNGLENSGLISEILITNSHNGQAAFKFHLGFFRDICLNSLVVADKAIDNLRIRHFSISFDTIEQYMISITSKMTDIIKNINRYKSIKLDTKQQIDFATRAMLLRNDEQIDSFTGTLDMVTFKLNYKPDELLAVQRIDDNSNDLFTIFNRIQENLINGNYNHYKSKSRPPRPLVENRKLLIVNIGLWSLMNTYSESLK